MNDLKALLQEHAVKPAEALDVDALWQRSQRRSLLYCLRRAVPIIAVLGLVGVPVQSALSPADRGGGRLETVAPEPGVDDVPTIDVAQESASVGSSAPRVHGGSPAPAPRAVGGSSGSTSRPAVAGPLAPASEPAPTSAQIAFARGPRGTTYEASKRERALVVANADGSNPRTIVSGVGATSPSWAPDGARILFNGLTATSSGSGDLGELWLVNPDGSGLRELGRGAAPEWSPDGRSIAYMCCKFMYPSIEIAPVGPDGVPNLEEAVTVTSGNFNIDPTWSPDGRRIAFVRSYYELAAEAGVYEIWTVDANGENEKKLADVPGSPPMYALQDGLSWSPDGQRLAFACGDLSICLVDATSGLVTQVPGAVGNAPAWVDENVLLFACAGQGRQSICTINADGTNLRQLTTGGAEWDYTPAFSAG